MTALSRLLALRAFYDHHDMPAPVDLDARIAEAGGMAPSTNDTEDFTDHG